MKIVYVYSTMAATGGTERMITEKANYLSERFGYDITIISCFQLQTKIQSFQLSKKSQTNQSGNSILFTI